MPKQRRSSGRRRSIYAEARALVFTLRKSGRDMSFSVSRPRLVFERLDDRHLLAGLIDSLDSLNSPEHTADLNRIRGEFAGEVSVSPSVLLSEAVRGDGVQASEGLSAGLLENGFGDAIRVYRLAVAATGEYTSFFGGVVADAYAAIESTVDALNAIFEPELAIHFELVSGQSLVYSNAGSDPYSGTNLNSMLSQNQTNLDNPAVMGSANYDIGHVFSFDQFGGGGLASLGVVGLAGFKARGATISFDPLGMDFVYTLAHEFGHQFNAEHTFNSQLGSCGNSGQYAASSAYEVGSGSTLMSYAGICSGDNLQDQPDAVFHSASQQSIHDYIVDNLHAAPNSTIVTGNSIPTVDAGSDYVIPARTPFALTAVGSDADVGDLITYSWEELDLGPSQNLPLVDNGTSPLFRAFAPVEQATRSFPRFSDLLANVNTAAIGEALPSTDRELNLRATVRDGNGGVGADDVLLTVVDTGAAFSVTSPDSAADSWTGGATETVSWNVAFTDGSGINTANVRILLSTDGGNTFPFVLATTANDGTHDLVAPNINSSEARIKIEAVGNIFFDISNFDFSITADPGVPGVALVTTDGSVRVAESGGVDTYDISLNTDPGGDVSILVTADPQTLISTDGVNYASTQNLMFSSMAAQTITVRAVDDSVEEGAHASLLTHVITTSNSSAYPVELLIDNVVAIVTDDELPPVVGLDFDFVDGGYPAPENWTQRQFFSNPAPVDMPRDDGVATAVDFRIEFLGGGFQSVLTPAISNFNSVPRHSPELREIDGFSSATIGIRAIWEDLTPGAVYGVYVFGLEADDFDSFDQNISIAGATTLPSFNQVLIDGQLQVNDEMGTVARTLKSYEKVVAANLNGEIRITITPNPGSDGIALGGLAIREIESDYGDAPDASQSGFANDYPVSLLDDGARHAIVGPRLGASRDSDDNGRPAALADGDDLFAVDDEDGVQFGVIQVGASLAAVNVFLENATAAKLDAWIDFDRNGIWEPSEQIFDDQDISDTMQTLNFVPPAGMTAGQTYARFRVSSDGNLEPTGAALDGEVEDYLVEIVTGAPTVESVVINDGEAQRSSVDRVTLTFDRVVQIASDAFHFRNTTTDEAVEADPDVTESDGKTVVDFAFLPGLSVAAWGTLLDGAYELVIDASMVTSLGTQLDGDADGGAGGDHVFTDSFFRRYGDATGNGTVELLDFAAFRRTYGQSLGDPGYESSLDANGDDTISLTDFGAFRNNYGS